jgi:hypothetical protein
MLIKTSELRMLLKKIFLLTKNLVITNKDTDDFATCVLSPAGDVPVSLFPHPYFWKRLGFTFEYPEQDFAYVDPTLNKWDRILLTPQNSRWGGGLLTLDALLFFLQNESTRKKASEIFKKRTQLSGKKTYRILVVAMELARSLGLVLYLFSSVEFCPGAAPVQPHVAPTPPFFADFLDTAALKNPEHYYPMRGWWHMCRDTEAFSRLFSLSFLVFDFLFETTCEDPQASLQMTGALVEEFINTSDSLGEVEIRVREMVEGEDTSSRELSHTENDEL